MRTLRRLTACSFPACCSRLGEWLLTPISPHQLDETDALPVAALSWLT